MLFLRSPFVAVCVWLLHVFSAFECEAASEFLSAEAGNAEDEGQMSKLLGPSVLAWSSPAMEAVNVVDTDIALSRSSVVGAAKRVLFSASWCGPCKQFVPLLEEFYQRINQKGKERFDIVWVSINRDETEEEFFHYFRSMPWMAVPQEQIPLTLENTAELFKLTGIPYLVLLDGSDGSIISLEGREKILNDNYGIEFPWRSRSLLNFLPEALKKRVGRLVGDVKSSLARMLHPMNVVTVTKNVIVRAFTLAFRMMNALYSYMVNRGRRETVTTEL